MQNELIEQGLMLMLYGMGTVFVFLAVLVVVTSLMSAIVKRFFSSVEQKPVNPLVNSPSDAATVVNDPKLAAVIEAAIRQHRAVSTPG